MCSKIFCKVYSQGSYRCDEYVNTSQNPGEVDFKTISSAQSEDFFSQISLIWEWQCWKVDTEGMTSVNGSRPDSSPKTWASNFQYNLDNHHYILKTVEMTLKRTGNTLPNTYICYCLTDRRNYAAHCFASISLNHAVLVVSPAWLI